MKVLISLILLHSMFAVNANNLQITAPVVNVGEGTISFTIAWENSWYTSIGPGNWDAVWIFVKTQSCTDNLWVHAGMSPVSTEHHVSGELLQVDAVNDGTGVFIRRKGAGSGTVGPEIVSLKLQEGIQSDHNYQVFGFEMVNIPEGAFYLGDGTKGYNEWSFGNSLPPHQAVLIDAALQAKGIDDPCELFPNCGEHGVKGGKLPPEFPMGYHRFYCMKYEISQAQYAAFLNSLTFVQQMNRSTVPPNAATGTNALSAPPPDHNRNSIRIQIPGVPNAEPALYACDLNNNGIFNESDDGQNIACNFLSWADLIAYLDWAALRPMTEFEFEKICRGEVVLTQAGEYAWGNTSITKAVSYALHHSGSAAEIAVNAGDGLCAFGAEDLMAGPLRCGFAATSSTNRAGAGASYYGVMEMSGNVMEQCVGGQNFDYSSFTSMSGNGELSDKGAADTPGWPTAGGGQKGGILRGGNWYSNNTIYLNVSNRSFLQLNTNQIRDLRIGGRGVKSW